MMELSVDKRKKVDNPQLVEALRRGDMKAILPILVTMGIISIGIAIDIASTTK